MCDVVLSSTRQHNDVVLTGQHKSPCRTVDYNNTHTNGETVVLTGTDNMKVNQVSCRFRSKRDFSTHTNDLETVAQPYSRCESSSHSLSPDCSVRTGDFSTGTVGTRCTHHTGRCAGPHHTLSTDCAFRTTPHHLLPTHQQQFTNLKPHTQTTHTNHPPTHTHQPTAHRPPRNVTDRISLVDKWMPCIVISCHNLSLSGLGNVRACCLP